MNRIITNEIFSGEVTANEKTPFFSVVIPTYNRKETILRAVHSLLNQTEKDWEAIIVDDGSSDNTHLVLSDILRKNKNIKYIRQENQGAALSKNTGLQHANGLFFTFLDSDDEYETYHLESRKKLLEENPEAQFLSGGLKIIGNPFVPDRFDSSNEIHLDECQIGGTFFIRRDFFYFLKGFRHIQLGEDADLFERAVKAGRPMIKTDLPSYIYHKETIGSITNQYEKSR